MNKNDVRPHWPAPWPVEAIIERLLEGQDLHRLVRPKQKTSTHDRREEILEGLVQEVLSRYVGGQRVSMRTGIGTILGLHEWPFPARTKPDVAIEYGGQIHIMEVKASRTDYDRFDSVFDSRPFEEYLASVGDGGKVPWEVEQDLIKLQLYKGLSPRVGSCLFLVVDARKGSGRSWTNVFSSHSSFVNTMRTNLIKEQAHQLLAATRIERLSAQDTRARLITCTVHP